jgi:hypothetical protein
MSDISSQLNRNVQIIKVGMSQVSVSLMGALFILCDYPELKFLLKMLLYISLMRMEVFYE